MPVVGLLFAGTQKTTPIPRTSLISTDLVMPFNDELPPLFCKLMALRQGPMPAFMSTRPSRSSSFF
jgi:hypothetical protein